MQPHYERKLEHALTLIKECAAKKIEDDNFAVTQVTSIAAIDNLKSRLFLDLTKDDMGMQKKHATEIAATTILYMVEFL